MNRIEQIIDAQVGRIHRRLSGQQQSEVIVQFGTRDRGLFRLLRLASRGRGTEQFHLRLAGIESRLQPARDIRRLRTYAQQFVAILIEV